MGCTCGSSGALDGHSPFCDLRKIDCAQTPEGLNRVTIGLPDRLDKTKIALREAEVLQQDLRVIWDNRVGKPPLYTLNEMAKRLGFS